MRTKLPTCFEMKVAIRQLGFSNADFAKLCGVSEGTVVRWCEGHLPIPGYAWNIVALMSGVTYLQVIAGETFRFDIEEEDIFGPGGYTRQRYLFWMKRLHPDSGKRTQFPEELHLINEIHDLHRKRRVASLAANEDATSK